MRVVTRGKRGRATRKDAQPERAYVYICIAEDALAAACTSLCVDGWGKCVHTRYLCWRTNDHGG
jgi:hypothetical protein